MLTEVTFKIRLNLEDENLTKNPFVCSNTPWTKRLRYWLASSRVELICDGYNDVSEFATSEEIPFTGTVGSVVWLLVSAEIARLEEGALLPVACGNAANNFSELADKKLGAHPRHAMVAMFPKIWFHEDGTTDKPLAKNFSKAEAVGFWEATAALLVLRPTSKKRVGLLVLEKRHGIKVFIETEVFIGDNPCDLDDLREIRAAFNNAQTEKWRESDHWKKIHESDRDAESCRTSHPTQCPEQFERAPGLIIGREWVFDEIDQYVAKATSRPVALPGPGYFCLIAPPGIGKSTIFEEYARRKRAPFAQFKGNIPSVDTFLEELHADLLRRYPLLKVQPPSGTAVGSSSYLKELLNAVASNLPSGFVLPIVIDGLDEAPEELLGIFPADLPRNVVILLSYRGSTEDRCPLRNVSKSVHTLLIMPNDERHSADIDEYMKTLAELEPLEAIARRSNKGIAEVIKGLKDRSENNFMYLRYVTIELMDGLELYDEISDLPQGLKGYYEHHLERLKGPKDGGEDWYSFTLPVLTALMESQTPIPLSWLQVFVSPPGVPPLSEFDCAKVLYSISQFLIEGRVVRNDGKNEHTSKIYHSDFRDYLRRHALIPDGRGTQDRIRDHMAMIHMIRYQTTDAA